MTPTQLILPWPPSMNRYWRSVTMGKRKAVLISKEGRKFRADVVGRCLGVLPFRGRLSVHIDAFPPDRRRRDLDNLLKPVLDALEHGGMYHDDCQIDHLSISRQERVKGGRIEISCREVDVS